MAQLNSSRHRFDPHALRRRAGDRVFERGKRYQREGLVSLVSLGEDRIVARVFGEEEYRVRLSGAGNNLSGECSCPAFAREEFCKHIVATALTVNVDDGAGEPRDALAPIGAFLSTLPPERLVDILLEAAERDSQLLNKLELAAAAATEDDAKIVKRLGKALDRATDTPYFIDYRQAPKWAAGVNQALAAIEDLLDAGRAAAALALADRALDGLEGTYEEVDDSDGHCGALVERAQRLHFAAAEIVRPEPVALARSLFERELGSDYAAFHGAGSRYEEVLGKVGLAEYRRLAEAAWEQSEASGRPGDDDGPSYSRYHLAGILDRFFERDGDIEARIRLRLRDLGSPDRYLSLARFCLSLGLEERALSFAEEGLWKFEDVPAGELGLFTATLLAERGRRDEAVALVWKPFERNPSLRLYQLLGEVGGEAECQRALALLEERAPDAKRSYFDSEADLLVTILIDKGLFDRAWTIERLGILGLRVREALARASDKDHPEDALRVYMDQVERLVAPGTGYEDAIQLIARMKPLRSAPDQAAYVADLKVRHKRKRNFMRLLA
jgi:hypothetical protein